MAEKAVSKSGVRFTWRGIVLVIIGVLLLVFAVQNFAMAPVQFLRLTVDLPVWLLVVGSFLLGMLLGGLVRGTARKLRKPHPQES
jgi:uncharacterized integral membrane protein